MRSAENKVPILFICKQKALQKYYVNTGLHLHYRWGSKHVFIGREGLENKRDIHICIHFKVLLMITENLALYPNITVIVHDH